MVRKRRCAHCGASFKPKLRDSKYCSRPCSWRGRRSGRTRPCDTCAEVFYVKRCDPATKRFCSKICHDVFQARGKIAGKCATCGDDFARSPSWAVRGNPKYCSVACRNTDPEFKGRLFQMSVANARSARPTTVERMGYELLEELGIHFTRQATVEGRFCVDAFVPDARLVIQFDGDYWHANPARYPEPSAGQRKVMQRDLECDVYLRGRGYTVLRFWESDVLRDPRRMQREVVRALRGNGEVRPSAVAVAIASKRMGLVNPADPRQVAMFGGGET